MKELEDLDEDEKIVLLACYDANKGSLRSRVPIEAITRRIKILPSSYKKKAIKLLRSNGFIFKHPSGRKMTYQLTKKGLKAGYKLYKNNI